MVEKLWNKYTMENMQILPRMRPIAADLEEFLMYY